MKILVISDSHGNFKDFYDVCIKESPEAIIFLGDLTEDAYEMSSIFQDVKFYIVRGNCDYNDFRTEDEKIIEIKGIKILLTHGHMYQVKRNYRLISAKLKCADIVLFGHTHAQYLEKKENKILFNPGALILGEYGLIKIENNKQIKIKHKNLG
ncbi:metallophosphoesterase family protein [Fusobacterium sp. MFO224]|uniref:metallophosphoesterase family protein n=1 Tax=Fusobacterium sp. MFO224 TaxID=3378070 RepID=UPI003852F8F3